MATLAELRALVSANVQNASFNTTTIDSYLNRGVTEIAGGMPSTLGSFITPPLPDLFTIATVATVTNAAYVSMPATFQRNLQFVSDSNGIEVDIANSMIEFSSDYPLMNGSGSVESVIEQGGNIYYQRIPTAAMTLTLHFYRLPVDMSLTTSVPDGIPSSLAVPLLVNYACKEIFSIIEAGQKTQLKMLKHIEMFNAALRQLELSIPFDSRSLFLGD